MSANNQSKTTPIEDKTELIEYLEAGCKSKKDWRIGTEHEKFGYHLADLSPLEYEGPAGVRALLERFTRFGWTPVLEGENPIALSKPDGSFISLEPAGQLELSGAPLETIHQTCDEVTSHLQQVKAIARELDLGFIGLGYHPKLTASDMPWMPKGRYEIMRKYMPKKGTLGLEMMQATCTVQVNLDFSSEEDMVKMYRISMALQPVATALWANSPFRKGRPSGFLSYRSHIWTDTDPDRSGMLPFVFEDGFGFERYVDYLLDMPMYFVNRKENYIDVSGQSFRHFLDGKLPALPNEKPHLGDWINHISTAFPEVRLKQFMEMRGTDGGPWGQLCALPAFWIGLLYDEDARDAAWDLIKDWSIEELDFLRAEVPRRALRTPFRNRTVLDVALDALQISHKGLYRRQRIDSLGMDETHFIKPLFQIVHSGLTPADELLAAFKGRWEGSIDPIFQEYAY